MAEVWWPVDATLWMMPTRRWDGRWVVTVGMRGAPVMLSAPFDSEDAANRAIARYWAATLDTAHWVLIGPNFPETGPI